ncbi:MAG TPA: hypothetical protein PKO39_06145 [Bacilli bacterium]|jgi:hypothetical protein|nr:hypothetical protein [Bacilli bacterium]HQC90049.1 hypothetical protein [Bacilli bacterium]
MRRLVLLVSVFFLALVVLGNVCSSEKDTLNFTLASTIPENKKLIPRGAVLGKDDVDEIKIVYKIQTGKNRISDYGITIRKITIGEKAVCHSLLNYEVNMSPDGRGSFILTIILTLNEAKCRDEYLAVCGKTISFEVQIRFYR